jgi:hypothetical protein
MSDTTANHVGQNTCEFRLSSSSSKTQSTLTACPTATRFWYPWDGGAAEDYAQLALYWQYPTTVTQQWGAISIVTLRHGGRSI